MLLDTISAIGDNEAIELLDIDSLPIKGLVVRESMGERSECLIVVKSTVGESDAIDELVALCADFSRQQLDDFSCFKFSKLCSQNHLRKSY